jgi:hypothetical protein
LWIWETTCPPKIPMFRRLYYLFLKSL